MGRDQRRSTQAEIGASPRPRLSSTPGQDRSFNRGERREGWRKWEKREGKKGREREPIVEMREGKKKKKRLKNGARYNFLFNEELQ
jgi:hypothetical protein